MKKVSSKRKQVPKIPRVMPAPSISVEDLVARIERLHIEQKAADRTVDAYTGAIQEVEFWLGVVRGEHAAADTE